MPIPASIPDHSVIIAYFDTSCKPSLYSGKENCSQQQNNFPNINTKLSPKSKDISKIDDNFLCSPETILLINQTILKI